MTAAPDGYVGSESDPIRPVHIHHEVDEIWDGGNLEQWYNFIDYEFEQDGVFARARVYTDAIDTVALFGPFRGRNTTQEIAAPAFIEAVRGYLKRRFNRIQRLTASGYKTEWERVASG